MKNKNSDKLLSYGNLDRTMVIVDLENACGGSTLVSSYEAQVHCAVSKLVAGKQTNFVLSTGPQAVKLSPDFLWRWKNARFLTGYGVNGADLALIDVLDLEPMAQRSTEVVLVSGDKIFAPSIAQLGSKGIKTTVVAREGTLAKELRLATSNICLLPNFAQVQKATDPKEAA